MKLRQYQLTLLLLATSVFSFAKADIAVVVNPVNPVRALDSATVQRIFSGTLRTFPSTGMAATALDQPQSAEIYATFYKKLLNSTPEKMNRRRAAFLFSGQGVIPLTGESDDEIKALIAKKPSAIGYINASSVDRTVVVVYRIAE